MGYNVKPNKNKNEVKALKQERTQYLQMLMAAQAGREVNEEVFGKESSTTPPSLTRNGETYFGKNQMCYHAWRETSPVPVNPLMLTQWYQMGVSCYIL